MWYSGTAPQRRVTVVFRIILAIPQFVVLIFLGIAGFFVAVIGWFAALFTGRLPDFAHTYLSGLIRWEIRVDAYMFLLTDQYPPFSFEDVEYPVRPILPGRRAVEPPLRVLPHHPWPFRLASSPRSSPTG